MTIILNFDVFKRFLILTEFGKIWLICLIWQETYKHHIRGFLKISFIFCIQNATNTFSFIFILKISHDGI